MEYIDHLITSGLIAIFARPGAALLLSGIIFAGAAAVLFSTWIGRVKPLHQALFDRIAAVGGGVSADPAASRAAFARNYEAINSAMLARGKGAFPFQRAWLDLQRTFVDLEPGEISSSSRAGVFFGGAGDPGRAMDWWANIFVAIGLMMTFLGIVAALSQATNAIGAGGDATVMQKALASLLAIAAAKFWTSVAGIASSLVMRIVGRRWRVRLEDMEDELCESLDAGVRHISPQALALLQLSELKRIADALARTPDAAREGTVASLDAARAAALRAQHV